MFGLKKKKKVEDGPSVIGEILERIHRNQMALCENPETVKMAIMQKFNFLYRDKKINEESFYERFEAEELKKLTADDVYEILFTDKYKY